MPLTFPIKTLSGAMKSMGVTLSHIKVMVLVGEPEKKIKIFYQKLDLSHFLKGFGGLIIRQIF